MASAFEDYVNLELPRRSTFLHPGIVTGAYDGDPNSGSAPDMLKNAPRGTWYYEVTANKWWRKKSSSPGDWSDQTSGGAAAIDQREETFTPTPGQTSFTLSASPATANDTSVFVNTVKYIYGVSYTVSGTNLTWLDNPFTLDALDTVEVVYFV